MPNITTTIPTPVTEALRRYNQYYGFETNTATDLQIGVPENPVTIPVNAMYTLSRASGSPQVIFDDPQYEEEEEPYSPEPEDMPRVAYGSTNSALDFFTPVHKIVGKIPRFSENVTESYVGLELENEATTPFELPEVSGWRRHEEGSLRNYGFEYVQQEPTPLKETKRKLGVLLRAINRNLEGGSCLNSIRTSVHVHFDVLQYNFIQILNLAIVYWLLESFITNFCGHTRKGNLFCLRLKDATAAQEMLVSCIKRNNPYECELFGEHYRYASLNLASVFKFGSIESRVMRGTDNFEDICTWLDTLESVKQFALKFNTPKDIYEYFISSGNPAEDLPRKVFGDDLYSVLLKHAQENVVASEIRDSFLVLTPIMLAHKDFVFKREIEKAEKKLAENEELRIRRAREFEELQSLQAQENTVGEDEIYDQECHYVFAEGETTEFIDTEGDI